MRLYGVFKDERDEDESVVGIISVFFADVDHRAVISRAGASDSSATPVMKARPRLPLCLSNYCAAAEGSFFILQEPWGDSTTLFWGFGLFPRAFLSFFFFLFGYRVFARPDVLISIKVFNVLVPRLRCSFIASI